MNYRTLSTDELERLAYLGDAEAKLALADISEMVPLAKAEMDAADSFEEGEEQGYKNACKHLFDDYMEAIIAASNGNRDDDVCESLKQLATFLEDNS